MSAEVSDADKYAALVAAIETLADDLDRAQNDERRSISTLIHAMFAAAHDLRTLAADHTPTEEDT